MFLCSFMKTVRAFYGLDSHRASRYVPLKYYCHAGLDPVSSKSLKDWIADQARNDQKGIQYPCLISIEKRERLI